MTDRTPSPAPAPNPGNDASSTLRRGTLYGLTAYGLWGAFPLYFASLKPAGPLEILGHRIVWSLVLCLVAMAVMGQFRWFATLLRTPRQALTVGLAGALIAANWTVYIFAVLTGHVTEAALGYFLNPLVTVGLGVLVLKEGLRPWQWVAVGIGTVAACYLTLDYGRPPWVSFSLAFSFAAYGLLKKRVGDTLTAWQSLSGETLLLAPFAVALLVWIQLAGDATFTTEGAGHIALLVSCGVATVIPLLLFAGAARRVPLVTIGMLQFITPVLQLLCGVLLLGEVMPTSRWIGFALVWAALVVLTVDSVHAAGRSRRLARAAQGAAI
ncbi:EamA family transporter RarD [Ornithinicoccus hortensis]|uniref:Chloramphenicol-sensitive protein RarD n=1 Tax=Ornithinicoccus hortensis TaxID=82346 RepID=A0A542YPU5_9MICO|nr:EamA family transporter RarD [Ornithinicoccus hortensis]TQL49944.1 chloramphenicol-sensitive protein RarD [Ornithinicoccus hortensis]